MGAPCTWPTAVSAIGPTAVGSMAWLNHGQPHLSVAVKARFALRHDATMLIAKAPQLLERDAHADGDPTRSLVRASDMVPYRPAADIWLTGHAHAPRGRVVTVSVVRLALYRGGEALLDKMLHVVGDRVNVASPPEPFAKLPILYERAYGGIGFDANPVGVGADERPLLPNVVYPDTPERPAGLGPVSRYWKLRRGTMDTHQRRELERQTPSVPEGFDWRYFQAAPADQRVPFLNGDEWLVLDGLHASMVRLQSRLPKARGVARILSTRGDDRGDALAMVADTLAIDADEQTCSITWRGSVVLDHATELENMLVAGGVELDGRAVDWSQARVHAIAPRRAVPGRSRDVSGVTIVGAEPIGEPGDDLGATNIDARHPSEPTLPAFEIASDGAYQRVEVDSGEWSSDAWPMYPLAGIDEEVTETKTRADAHRLMVEERPTEIEQASIPMPIDTEPGRPPAVVDDELAWVNEPAVEPEDAHLLDDEIPTDRPPDSESPERTEVMERSALPLAQPKPARRRSALPLGGRVKPKHISDMRPRITSRPPAPLDLHAYEASLRQAGASDEDIAHLLESFRGSPK